MIVLIKNKVFHSDTLVIYILNFEMLNITKGFTARELARLLIDIRTLLSSM